MKQTQHEDNSFDEFYRKTVEEHISLEAYKTVTEEYVANQEKMRLRLPSICASIMGMGVFAGLAIFGSHTSFLAEIIGGSVAGVFSVPFFKCVLNDTTSEKLTDICMSVVPEYKKNKKLYRQLKTKLLNLLKQQPVQLAILTQIELQATNISGSREKDLRRLAGDLNERIFQLKRHFLDENWDEALYVLHFVFETSQELEHKLNKQKQHQSFDEAHTQFKANLGLADKGNNVVDIEQKKKIYDFKSKL